MLKICALFILTILATACGGSSSSTVEVIITPITDELLIISGNPDTEVIEEDTYHFAPSITPDINVTFSISNKPSWASFDLVTGELTGVPGNTDIGIHGDITITVTDGITSSSIGPFSITVNALTVAPIEVGTNNPPVLADQTKSDLSFSSAVAFTLTASDVDSTSSSYVYSVTSSPSHGNITIIDASNSSFSYQPTDVGALDGDSFTLQLSDGESLSTVATISLAFSDSTAPNITFTPANSATNVATNTSFSITSDDPLDSTTLTYNSTAGSCTGNLQISKDAFSNCIAISSAATSNFNRSIAITSAVNLDAGFTYSFKIKNGLTNYDGTALAAEMSHSFTTFVGSTIAISGSPSTSINEESAYGFTPTIDSAASGSLLFSITGKPSWASFNTSTGALTGTPDDAHIGTATNITITATDDITSSSIGPFSITVNAVNDSPVLADQTKSGLTFSSAVAFTLSASDVDSATSTYVYSVISSPSHGSIVITNHTTSSFEYQPSSVSGISGDSFTVQLSDGSDVSNTRTITLTFSDATAPSLTLTPNHNAANVAVDTTYLISSDDPIDTATLSYNSSTAACTGTVQISKDSFTNCIGITSAVASNLNRTITITGAADIDSDTEYKIKVTTGVANLLAVSVASDVTNTFNTSANGLLITEVGETGAKHDQRWFEIFNATSSVIDISDYSVKTNHIAISSLVVNGNGSFSYSYSLPGAYTFTLPSKNIQPGQYMMIWSTHIIDAYTPNSRDVYINDGSKYPYWDGSGFIELIKAGVTEDFVTFGAGYTPTTSAEWSGTFATALPSIADQYGHSIGRSGSNADTNTAADWSSYSFSTMGGTNDVTCTTDADADGIPDCSEVSGSTFAGLPLYDWGARTGQKDIFIEVDYMDATNSGGQLADEGITPRREALQAVIDSFAAQGIVVHFDVGDLYDQATGVDAADFDLGGGGEVPFAAGMSFDPVDGRANTYDYKRDYMDYARMQIFHYLIFANSQLLGGGQGSSGLAELNGNDLIVTLGDWSLNSNTVSNTNMLINFQASTLMHELGHNLGLGHGGNDDSNNKPNYFSIMNYTYQLYGLSEIGNNEGDRHYQEFYSGNPNCFVSPLNKSYTTTDFIMSYSHGASANLNLSSINETLGLGQIGSDAVDYNCNTDLTETSANIGSGSWTDHDDWSNLALDFQHYLSGNNSGVSLFSSSDLSNEDQLMPDKVGDDRTAVAKEYAPSAAFFQQLQEQLQQ